MFLLSLKINIFSSQDSKNMPSSRSSSPINLALFRSSSPYVTSSSKLDVDDSQSDLNETASINLEMSSYEANIMAKTSPFLNSNGRTPVVSAPSPAPFQSKSSFKSKHNLPIESGQTPGPLGDIELQMSHNEAEQQLVIKILRGKCLPAKDANGFSDPFVKVCLLPGRE